MSIDRESAEAELERFAEYAGIDTEDMDEDSCEPLIRALMGGRMTVDESGCAEVRWDKPPAGHPALTLNPDSWPYAKALRMLSTKPVSSAAKKRGPAGDDELGRLFAFLDTLGGLPRETTGNLQRKSDVKLATALAGFIAMG